MAIIEDSVSTTITVTPAIDRDVVTAQDWAEAFGVTGTISSEMLIAIAWSEQLGIAVAFTLDRVLDADVPATLNASTSFALVTEVGASLISYIQAGFTIPLFDSAGEVWVVTPGGRTTRYEGFDYTGFAQCGGAQYGVKADGIYRLEGDDDAGAPIRASINFGKQAFGTSKQKRPDNIYIGVSSSGTMYLKIIVEGAEYLYAARSDSENMQMQRFDPGKGIRANYLTFELLNSNGCDFDLDTAEFMVSILDRRI